MSSNPDQNSVQGRLALITGASGGIGSACARQLATQGTHLALTYTSNEQNIRDLVSSLAPIISQKALRVTTHRVNLEHHSEIENLFKEIQKEHQRPVDILVSNAGYGKRIQNIWDIPLEEFNRMISVNLTASFLLVKGVVGGMKDQNWGRIIFISSVAAYGAGMNGCHYASSKAGLIGMMKNLSARLAEFNISVNDVAPAMVGSTGMLSDEKAFPGLTDSIPLRRLCTPIEVANAVIMFATTGFATGQSLVVGGGLR
ncbi:NAD(P)-binding protein [Penicillium longicatenatum]|uniref:NAD(P)-binding protein n=1 Tax=Penicillium longicatenatum TaxID=1561947 RepID=UPI00254749E0|nr:NAD(P)-binding protein [Penicillium longicatenatum]KAJ5661085.1 NAD(P)-binding protein [Penicillium longicatenatum]